MRKILYLCSQHTSGYLYLMILFIY